MASYPRRIPAGGEGTIRITVDTNGYGGRMLKKNVAVFTNDPTNERISLVIRGSVLRFARIEPSYVRLTGQAGNDIKKTITITREKRYPFTILDVKAQNGKEIRFAVDPFDHVDATGYVVTVENRKSVAGRYADRLILTTDSTVKPTLIIPVYGQIAPTPPETEAPPENGDNHDG